MYCPHKLTVCITMLRSHAVSNTRKSALVQGSTCIGNWQAKKGFASMDLNSLQFLQVAIAYDNSDKVAFPVNYTRFKFDHDMDFNQTQHGGFSCFPVRFLGSLHPVTTSNSAHAAPAMDCTGKYIEVSINYRDKGFTIGFARCSCTFLQLQLSLLPAS